MFKKKNATLEDIPLDIGMGNETSTGFYQGEKGKFVRHFIIDWDSGIKILLSNINSVSSEITEDTPRSTPTLTHRTDFNE